MHAASGARKPENGGDIQATTKAVDCRSLKSSPPFFLSGSAPLRA
jgi:hypothetical protein